MRRRKRWLLVAAVVLAVVLGFVAYSFFSHSGTATLTISELRSQAESLYNQPVRVEGKVASGSINWDDKTNGIRFTLTDDKENLIIVYTGFVPDNFKPEVDLVVTGKYRPDDVFEAMSLGNDSSFCIFCH